MYIPSAHLGRHERSHPRKQGSRHLRAVQGYSPVIAVGHFRRLPVEAPLEAPVFPESHPGRALARAQQAVDAVVRRIGGGDCNIDVVVSMNTTTLLV